MSDTPRTDEVDQYLKGPSYVDYGNLVDFARQLERELAAGNKTHQKKMLKLAQKMIKLCPGDLFCSEKGTHDCMYHCGCCWRFEEKTCPARCYLASINHPDAWEMA